VFSFFRTAFCFHFSPWFLFRSCYIFISRCILTSGPCWFSSKELFPCFATGWFLLNTTIYQLKNPIILTRLKWPSHSGVASPRSPSTSRPFHLVDPRLCPLLVSLRFLLLLGSALPSPSSNTPCDPHGSRTCRPTNILVDVLTLYSNQGRNVLYYV
jgi:hypothetical protein